MFIQAPRGTKDVLPQDSYRWQVVEAKMRKAAAGFGMGIERLLMLLDSEGVQLPCPDTLDVFVTYMGQAKLAAFRLVEELRAAGIKADMDHCGRSLKAQFKFANKTGAPLTATLGEEELAQGVVKLRDMNTRQERVAPMAEAAQAIREMLDC